VSEVVWNETANNEGATGGGVSNLFPLPSWQANSKVPASSASAGGRGVPDVTGDADPTTGYTIRVDGQTSVIGGTSAVAPLWAGLIAVANQQLGTQVGFIQPAIYAAKAAAAFNDITQGNNGAFSAGPGWDACSGLGSPIASKLIPLLAPAGVAVKASAGKGAKKAVKKTASKKTSKKAAKKAAKKTAAKKKKAKK
jgi:kumamolisin